MAVVVGLAATAAGLPAASAARAGKPALGIGVSADFLVSLNPAMSAGASTPLRPLMYEPFIHQGPDGQYLPDLAMSWRYVPGHQNKLFELTLRHNVRFSDGTMLTAAAAATWFKYVSKIAGGSAIFGTGTTFQTIGKWTLRIHMTISDPALPWELSDDGNGFGYPTSPKCIATPKVLSTKTCGAGPYEIDYAHTVLGNRYAMVPNPNYYDPSKQYWSKVQATVISSPSSMLEALKAGQIQVAMGDPSTDAAAAAAGFKVSGGLGTNDVMFLDTRGAKVKALGDIRVRQAMNYAIDRQAIVRLLGGKKFAVATDEMAGADGQVAGYQNYYKYDPAKAKALLAAAGYSQGFTISPAIVDGFDGAVTNTIMEIVAQNLSQVGITLQIKSDATIPLWVQDTVTDPSPLYEIGPTMTPTWTYASQFYAAGGAFNKLGGGFNDPVVNAAAAKASIASDPSKYWAQLTIRCVKQAYFLPIVRTGEILYYNTKKVKGVIAGLGRANGAAATEWSPAK